MLADPTVHKEVRANAERQLRLTNEQLGAVHALIEARQELSKWEAGTSVHPNIGPLGNEADEREARMKRRFDLQQRLNQLQREWNALESEGRTITESLRSPYEAMIDAQARLVELLKAGAIHARVHGLAMQKAAWQAASSYLDLAAQIGSALATIFGKSKAAAVGSAIINTAQSITRALAVYGPTPMGWGAAAAAAASGAAQLAAIRSASVSGGGRTPSTRSGSASTEVPAASGGGGAPTTVLLQPHMPTQMFSRDALRQLVEELNAAHRDGYRLVVT